MIKTLIKAKIRIKVIIFDRSAPQINPQFIHKFIYPPSPFKNLDHTYILNEDDYNSDTGIYIYILLSDHLFPLLINSIDWEYLIQTIEVPRSYLLYMASKHKSMDGTICHVSSNHAQRYTLFFLLIFYHYFSNLST